MSALAGRKFEALEKYRVVRNIVDRFYIIGAGSFWIIGTLWDIYLLQRYWLDYAIEFYTTFLMINMMVFSVKKELLPSFMYKSFRMITTIPGRGTMLLLISILFLGDKHSFHKLCAIILLIGGLLYFVSEILVPTTKEELTEIAKVFGEDANNGPTTIRTSESSSNNGFNFGNMGNKKSDKQHPDSSQNALTNIAAEGLGPNGEEGNIEKLDKMSSDVKVSKSGNLVDEEQPSPSPLNNLQQTTNENPYDIPEDF